MAPKPISRRTEAYERLRRAKLNDGSFSDVVMRASWEEMPVTGKELVTLLEERGALYSGEEFDEIEAVKAERPERPGPVGDGLIRLETTCLLELQREVPVGASSLRLAAPSPTA